MSKRRTPGDPVTADRAAADLPRAGQVTAAVGAGSGPGARQQRFGALRDAPGGRGAR